MVHKITITYTNYAGEMDYYITLEERSFSFTIDEPYIYTASEIDAMVEGKEGSGIGGGGNSNWGLIYKNGTFQIEYEISGMGMGSSLSQILENDEPILEMLKLIRVINKLHSEKKRYVSSSDNIKVSKI